MGRTTIEQMDIIRRWKVQIRGYTRPHQYLRSTTHHDSLMDKMRLLTGAMRLLLSIHLGMP